MSNIIEVKNLVKNYKDVHAVNDISFTVEEGSFFAFLGINGAGKSTTINILCTVLEKTSGDVKIGGYDLDKEKNKIKELIGIVFQGSVLDKQLTVKENLESRASYYGLNKKEIAKRIESLTQTFDLSEILKRKYAKFEDETTGLHLAFTGAVKDEIMDVETLGCHLMAYLGANYPEALKTGYKLPALPEREDGEEDVAWGYRLLEAAGKKRGFLISGGEVDTERMAKILLDEYRAGKLGRFTLEMPEETEQPAASE